MNKIFTLLVAGLVIAGLVASVPFALADRGRGRSGDNHGSEVSDVARESNRGPGHGDAVSNEARDNDNSGPGSINSNRNRIDLRLNDDDEDEDGDIRIRDENIRIRVRGDIETRLQQLQEMINRLQALLRELIERNGSVSAPVISSVAATDIESTEAKIVWVTDKPATSKVFFSTSSPINLATAMVKAKGGLDINHRISLDDLAPNTVHFFIVESADSAGRVSRSSEMSFRTLPAPLAAPVISNVTVSNIASSSARITWLTDKPATSKVFFSTVSPINLATASVVSNAALVTSHSLDLTGLASGITIFFIVESADAAGNIVRSAQSSFTTLAAGPAISAINVSGITATSATINWTTDRAATSKVFFSTTSPINLATANSVTVSALTTAHAVALLGLTSNTTFFFVVESMDADGRVSRSSQLSFTTTP